MAEAGRRDETVFFIYDHNLLKKEEDDLIDAILYFSPEHVSADDQCALCGQLMGMAEFLTATLGKSSPKIFKFEHEKYAIKRIGGYSLGLKCKRNDPDSIVFKQLDNLYGAFVTFHGSLNSLRLRCKDNNNNFEKDLGNIWRTILHISGVSFQPNLSKTFHHLPYIQLPKTGSHLYLQASHLLQSSQRRPYVRAGAILYKNEVVCTQLPPTLTRQLTYLKVQMPYIEQKMDFELPVGCKLCTLFLTDEELLHIFPLDPYSKRHCKMTDFSSRRDNEVAYGKNNKSSSSKLSTRRQTCPNISSSLNMYEQYEQVKTGAEQTSPSLFGKDGKGLLQRNANFIGVDRHTWGKSKTKVSLSHVPIVECRSGESPEIENQDLIDDADENHFGRSYRSSMMNQPYSLESLQADVHESDNDSEDDFGLSEAEKYLDDDRSHSQSTNTCSDKEASLSYKLNANYAAEKSVGTEKVRKESNDDSDSEPLKNKTIRSKASENSSAIVMGGNIDVQNMKDNSNSNLNESLYDTPDTSKEKSTKFQHEAEVHVPDSAKSKTVSELNALSRNLQSENNNLNHVKSVTDEKYRSLKKNESSEDSIVTEVHKTGNFDNENRKCEISENVDEKITSLSNITEDRNQCSNNKTLLGDKMIDRNVTVTENARKIECKSSDSETSAVSRVGHVNITDNLASNDNLSTPVIVIAENKIGEINENNHHDKGKTGLETETLDLEDKRSPSESQAIKFNADITDRNDREDSTVIDVQNRMLIKANVILRADDVRENKDSITETSDSDQEHINCAQEHLNEDDRNADSAKDSTESEKENFDPNCSDNVSKDTKKTIKAKVHKIKAVLNLDDNGIDEPCINCLEIRTENPEYSDRRCSQCLSNGKSQIINHYSDRKEVIDFSSRETEQKSLRNQDLDHTDTEMGKTMHSVISTDSSTFSSDVSTDSTISRFWTHEMDGLNDVTLYIQCHSDISLLLLMENPEQYQENLLHALWKGSLHYLADLDFYIKECLDQKEVVPAENFSFVQFSKFSRDLKENVEECSSKKKVPLNQIVSALHAEFDYHPSFSDVTLRSQANSCYGHRSEANETFFQLDIAQRPSSGLPVPKDPNYILDSVARTKLSKERHISLM